MKSKTRTEATPGPSQDAAPAAASDDRTGHWAVSPRVHGDIVLAEATRRDLIVVLFASAGLQSTEKLQRHLEELLDGALEIQRAPVGPRWIPPAVNHLVRSLLDWEATLGLGDDDGFWALIFHHSSSAPVVVHLGGDEPRVTTEDGRPMTPQALTLRGGAGGWARAMCLRPARHPSFSFEWSSSPGEAVGDGASVRADWQLAAREIEEVATTGSDALDSITPLLGGVTPRSGDAPAEISPDSTTDRSVAGIEHGRVTREVITVPDDLDDLADILESLSKPPAHDEPPLGDDPVATAAAVAIPGVEPPADPAPRLDTVAPSRLDVETWSDRLSEEARKDPVPAESAPAESAVEEPAFENAAAGTPAFPKSAFEPPASEQTVPGESVATPVVPAASATPEVAAAERPSAEPPRESEETAAPVYYVRRTPVQPAAPGQTGRPLRLARPLNAGPAGATSAAAPVLTPSKPASRAKSSHSRPTARAPMRPAKLLRSRITTLPVKALLAPLLQPRTVPWVIAILTILLFTWGWMLGDARVDGVPNPSPIEMTLEMLGVGGAHYVCLVRTEPAGASIVVDGKPTGRVTPASINLSPGVHKVRVEVGQWGGVTFEPRGRRGERVTLRTPLWGSISVRPSQTLTPVSVWIDGRARGAAPTMIDRLEPGPHEVGFSTTGATPWKQTVDVRVGRVSEIVAEPFSVPATGEVEIRGMKMTDSGDENITGAKVWIDGKLRGAVPMTLTLPRGPHSIRVNYRGEDAPVTVINLPGGNKRFVDFRFGSGVDTPRLVLQPNAQQSRAKVNTISAQLRSINKAQLSEMALYARNREGTWRRYPMSTIPASGGVIGIAVIPADVLMSPRPAPYYVSAVTTLGDEFFTEIQNVD